jgi:uncharacterized protein YndB with AHSA1/START domain
MLTDLQTQTLTFTCTLKASPAAVYRAWTNAMTLREWFCDTVQINAREGAPFFFGWNEGFYAVGNFTELKPDERLAFTWYGKDEPAPTQVEVILEGQGEATRVTLKQHGVGADAAWKTTIQQMDEGWRGSLENLQSVLETGLDLRIMRRPMLGIFPSPLTAEQAQKLGVPVTQGTYLDGVVAGLGAEAAGLQKGDVIVSLASKKVVDYPTMTLALRPYKGGDTVEVEYYRGGAKHNTLMTLSSRPAPDVPTQPGELAERLEQKYEEVNAALDAALANVTEAEASHQPAPGEWNVKEVLAHLIWSERYLHFVVWGMVGGEDNVPWPDNNPAQQIGILAACPSLVSLVKEFKQAEASTAATIAHLPATFLARKATYIRLGLNTLGFSEHTREHIAQIQAAVESARAKQVA